MKVVSSSASLSTLHWGKKKKKNLNSALLSRISKFYLGMVHDLSKAIYFFFKQGLQGSDNSQAGGKKVRPVGYRKRSGGGSSTLRWPALLCLLPPATPFQGATCKSLHPCLLIQLPSPAKQSWCTARHPPPPQTVNPSKHLSRACSGCAPVTGT